MVWDTVDNLRNAITAQWLWLSAAAVLVVLVGLLAAYKFYKAKPYKPIQHKQDGWTPTGRVDFIDLNQLAILACKRRTPESLTALVA